MNSEQVEIYKQIKAVDPEAAESYVAWCNKLKALGTTQEPVANGRRGAVLSRLREILGNVHSPGHQARHVWLEAVTGDKSTTGLTDAQAQYILSETAHRVDRPDGTQGWVIDRDTADMIRRHVIGIVMVNEEGDQMSPASAGPAGPPDKTGNSGPPSPSPQDGARGPGGPPAASQPAQVSEGALKSVKEAQHTEAPLSATCKVVKDGYEWLITLRAGTNGEMFKAFLSIIEKSGEFMGNLGFTPQTGYRRQVSQSDGGVPQSPSGPSGPSGTSGGIVEQGVAELEWVQVGRSQSGAEQVQFSLAGFNYPMKDARGVDYVVENIFDDELGLQEEHIRAGFDAGNMIEWYGQALKAHWQKKVKGGRTYWDVTRIARG
jgi:hypothetical protein